MKKKMVTNKALTKIITPIAVLSLFLAALSSCGSSGGVASMGLGIITNYGGESHTFSATSDDKGTVEIDSTAVLLALDSKGVIVKCTIDVAQTRADFDTTGHILTDVNAPVLTKLEKGTDYGMSKVTKKEEWFEQAADFEKWAVGKKIEDIKGLKINAEGHLEGQPDALASVSIGVNDWISALEKASANKIDAKDAGSDYKTGLGITTNFGGESHTFDASSDKEGKIEVDSTICALTLDKNGVIRAISFDVAQTSVDVDAAGQILTNTSGVAKSKAEKKEEYGMSAVTKKDEWYKQAATFEKWALGKTVAEVKGLKLSEAGKLEGQPDVLASVSVNISDWVVAVDRAAANAK